MLGGLFGRRARDPALAAAVDGLIEHIDPRLKLAGADRTLAKPARRAIEYARSLVDRLPPPLPLKADAWSSEPRLRAFFAAARDMGEILSRGTGVREYFERSAADEAYAVLGMTRKQQRVLTQALQGEVVQRDVPRTVVSFTDHRLSTPNATPEALRADLERRALEFVAERAAARLAVIDAERKDREQERDVLKARMRLAGRSGRGNEAAPDAAQLAASLKKCEGRLAELAGGLGGRVNLVAAVLAAPEKELELAVHTLRLDQMNFVAETPDAVCAEVTFVEATSAEDVSRVLVPVRIFRGELPPPRDVLADAEKLL